MSKTVFTGNFLMVDDQLANAIWPPMDQWRQQKKISSLANSVVC